MMDSALIPDPLTGRETPDISLDHVSGLGFRLAFRIGNLVLSQYVGEEYAKYVADHPCVRVNPDAAFLGSVPDWYWKACERPRHVWGPPQPAEHEI